MGLDDRHPYVRRTAVMGVLKILHTNEAVVHAQGLLEKVHAMLHLDTDPQVLSNCLTVLTAAGESGVLAADATLVYSLTNRIKDFSEWAQCQVLELVALYRPASESEVFDFLNTLEDRMGASNSAVVVAAIKAFLHLTIDMTATHQQVLERVRDPLRSLIGRESPSTAYAAMSHALLLVQRAPFVFEQDYAAFYCRAHDPWYIKKVKMEALAAVASPANVYDIVQELSEYTHDVHAPTARDAVRAIGRIALSVPDAPGVIERLLSFLDGGGADGGPGGGGGGLGEPLCSETVVQLEDVLRRFPEVILVCLPQLSELAPAGLETADARAAFAWIAGQFGKDFADAPTALRRLAAGWAGEQAGVRLALTRAAVQLFLKRPPECRTLLGTVLPLALEDDDPDVRDAAVLYYKLLKADPHSAATVVSPPLMQVAAFSEDLSQEARDAIFREFNTLSVVFRSPAASFVDAALQRGAVAGNAGDGGGGEAAPPADLLGPSGADAAAAMDGGAGGAETMLLDLEDSVEEPTDAGGGGDGGGGGSLDALGCIGLNGGGGGGGTDLSDLLGGVDGGGSGAAGAAAPVAAAPGVAGSTGAGLWGLEDLVPGGGSAASAANPGAAAAALTEDLQLDPTAAVSAAVFQSAWSKCGVAQRSSEQLSAATVEALQANNHRDFSDHMAQAYIMTAASGGTPPTLKFYLFGQVAGAPKALFLVEMSVRTDAQTCDVTVKSTAPAALLPQFMERWSMCLAGFHR
uniref:Beta-adaptin appendage C-terminal subdomain domain-containing protein n=1 Tax=Chlamydomonas euryale TaxID=1486919 RepID=A0A7R9Z186_9CHLO